MDRIRLGKYISVNLSYFDAQSKSFNAELKVISTTKSF